MPSINISVPNDLYSIIYKESEEKQVSVSKIIRDILKSHYKIEEETDKAEEK